MCKKLMFLVCLVAFGTMASAASAVEIRVDWGNQGTLDSSWTEWSSPSQICRRSNTICSTTPTSPKAILAAA